ncbi:MAG: restriction endonuclease [Candidatus Lambdaproteobacteria bacterium]|nr:restriction endonuclease [Candidatus Lambdaproteobacteria bacterium]
MPLPPYVPKSLVAERLPLIFPEGTPNRPHCIWDVAACTVFVMLYTGAVEGAGQYLGPKHVYRMTEEQAALADDDARSTYARNVPKPGYEVAGKRWYQDTTKEPIRDDTLRGALMPVGAVTALEDIPTTSPKPRYALKADFAGLFVPYVTGKALNRAIEDWQQANLTSGAMARISIVRMGAASGRKGIRVTFPSGETRQLRAGPSSVIAQAAVEVFAPRFLEHPAVLWLSESGNKVVARDDKLASAIGLKIEVDKNLPDLILADLGPTEPLLVFVEVVATDGAITAGRKAALLMLTEAAGFRRFQVAFVSAYRDRQSPGFKKTISDLAWGSFAWFASEPDQIMILRDGTSSPARLNTLMT